MTYLLRQPYIGLRCTRTWCPRKRIGLVTGNDAAAKRDVDAKVSARQALTYVKENAYAKFDESVEVAVRLGVDPRHADQMVRGVVNLPKGTGKDVRVAVFAKGDKADEARKAGAEVVGAEDLMEQIQGGQIDFERVIATPDMMGIVGRLGKVLGPKGLMPNPKLGTVTPNVEQAVKDAKGGARMINARAETAAWAADPDSRTSTIASRTSGETSSVGVPHPVTRRPSRSNAVPIESARKNTHPMTASTNIASFGSSYQRRFACRRALSKRSHVSTLE